MQTSFESPSDFRSHLPSQAQDGGRKWLYPRTASGRFTRARTAVAAVLLAALLAGPFVWADGHPLFLFDVLHRRFIFFGVTFWPQDFYLVAVGLLAFVVFVALFTVVYGRVFCGWACPQTIFMEMVFRRVETWIEGGANARRRLDAAPWTAGKIARKTAKHGVFFLLSFAIANTFLAYLIGRDQWLALITDPPARHVAGLAAMLVFTGVFYGVFAWMREIVCTTICPYGRLQGVLLDKDSLVVAYDHVRGEPRGKLRKAKPAPAHGDCVDCTLCVQVCPTGIDIRNGTQLECIHCTACVDACDGVMAKVGRPPGLIRLDSERGIQTRLPFRFTARTGAYTAVLAGLLSVLGVLLATRPALDATVLRLPGQLPQREAGGRTANLYSLEIINKTYRAMPVQIRAGHPEARIRFVQPLDTIPAGEMARTMFFLSLPGSAVRQGGTRLAIRIRSGGEEIARVETGFFSREKR